jgi:hypothetical protein
MSRRNELILLAVLVLALVGSFSYRYFSDASAVPNVPAAVEDRFTPVNVDNPALRLDILKRFLALEYKGAHRSIFSATLPPPPTPPPSANPVIAPTAPVLSGPPPLTVDAKYFGYVSDLAGSHRRAFFASSNNEDVFIAGEGDTLMGRFRVVRLTSTAADVEEVSSGRRATLVLEEPGPNG